MKDQHQTTQTMRDGTLGTFTNNGKAEGVNLTTDLSADPARAETIDIDDTKETVHTFLDKISLAKSQGDDSIETTDAIITHYNRAGLNGGKYFIFQGIKVYPKGQTDAIEAEERQQMGQKLHGSSEGRLDGGR